MPPEEVTDRFRKRLDAGIARQRRERILRAWAGVVGLLAALVVVSVVVVFSVEAGWPSDAATGLAFVWLLGAAVGTLSLFLFAFSGEMSARTRRAGIVALWAGNLSASVAFAALFPYAIPFVALPIAVGAALLKRHSHGVAVWLYVALPFALLGSRIVGERI